MDPGVRSPFIELFRRGEVPQEVRFLAGRGGIALPPLEQLGLLVLLTDDADVEVATAAAETLESIPADSLSAFLARSDVPEPLRAFFAARGIQPSSTPSADADKPLVEPAEEAADTPTDTRTLSLLSVVERMKIAMKGTREQRSVLIRDPNKIVAAAVLSCPKVTDTEAETFARMTNVSEEVLRMVGTNRNWVKNYGVAAALARNPKTPIAISLPLLNRLTERDVKMLATDRNIPEVIRQGCRKIVSKGRDRRE